MDTKPPNILLVTIDECKASALGCYGNVDAYTPTIDLLSSQGLTVQNSFTVSTKCVPARAALLTGRYPHTEGHRTLPGFEVRRGENNLVLELLKNKYRTAMFGKNHSFEDDVLSELFEKYHQPCPGIDVPQARREFENNDDLFRAFYRGEFGPIESMADTKATTAAIDFIKDQSSEPFFLLLNYNAPHPPYSDISPYIDLIRERHIKLPVREKLYDTPELLKTYRSVYNLEMLLDDDWRRIVESYYSMITFIDEQLSYVLNAIDEVGVADNTIIILVSDHGDFAGEHGCVEKWDTLFYDCLIKTPLIIRYPPRIIPGSRIDCLVEIIDVAPTILELCGYKIPSWMHGKSLIPIIEGDNYNHKEAVFCEGGVEISALKKAVHYKSDYHKTRHPNYYWKQVLLIDYPWSLMRAKMVRTKEWKLIYRVNGVKELYDLINDPEEIYDVSNKSNNKLVIYELMETLLKWAIITETDYPEIESMYS